MVLYIDSSGNLVDGTLPAGSWTAVLALSPDSTTDYFEVYVQNNPPSTSGAPTFTYSEPEKRADKLNISSLAVSEAEQRRDAVAVAPTLTEKAMRSDVVRIPTASVQPAETSVRGDRPAIPSLSVSDPGPRRGDVATIRVLLSTPGTYSIPAPVTGTYMFRAWQSGAGPGAGTGLNGGGGGAGGTAAESATVSATKGNALTVLIGASVKTAATAGAPSYISTTGTTPTTTAQGVLATGAASGSAAGTTAGGAGGTAGTTGSVGTTLVAGTSGSAGSTGNGGKGGTGASLAGVTPGTGGTGASTTAAATAGTAPGGGAGGNTATQSTNPGSGAGLAQFTFNV